MVRQSPAFRLDPPSPSPSSRRIASTSHMTSALTSLSPSLQPAYPHRGHSTQVSADRLPDSLATSSANQLNIYAMPVESSPPTTAAPSSKSKSKRAKAGVSDATGTYRRMDTVLNSKAALNHDVDTVPGSKKARVPKAGPSKRSKPLMVASAAGLEASSMPLTSTSQAHSQASHSSTALDLAAILSTPRRGRRVGGIDMGWESPIVDRDEDTLQCPHTLPKASRVRKAPATESELFETPTKRKPASTAFARDPKQPQRTLVDTHGWASAAMISAVPLTEACASPSLSSPKASDTPNAAASVQTKSEGKNAWPSFDSPVAPSTPRLVPLEVAGLGRVAVHREFAGQISEQAPRNKAFSGIRRHDSFCSDYASGLSDASGTGSSLGTSTIPTSVGTPCPGGVSPSFSLSSQFPSSEPNSPFKRAAFNTENKVPTEPVEKARIEAPSSKQTAASFAGTLDNDLWRPRLGGSLSAFQVNLPSLEWPDGPAGPWAVAGQHLDVMKQRRKEGVQKWLETDLDDESACSSSEAAQSNYTHHPMVAKALLDRARKQGQELLSAASRTSESPSKRSRKSRKSTTEATTPSRRGRKPRPSAADTPSSRRSVATAASLARSHLNAIRGCKCGIEDESIVMVRCDHCHRWLHLPCVGIANASELDDEWYCDDCCERVISEHLSPASSLPTTITSFADLSTPEEMQAMVDMCEPVFALPSGTPIHRRSAALSSSIALAPSPPMMSISQQSRQPTNSARRQPAGRARAERVGWRMNEPGSPLARKSTTASGFARHVGPETPSRATESIHDPADAATTPSLLAGFSRSDWEPAYAKANISARPTTPSPRLAGLSTPSRWASGRKASHAGGALSIGFSEDEHAHAADVFSTPSRLASGSAWGLQSFPGSQTPSRTLRGHHRVDSFSGGLSTPGRDLLTAGGAFGADHSVAHSGGLSTLAFSGSSLDGMDDHFADGGYHLNRAWQLQSPTSSTRAARSRQISGFGTPSSSSLLRTPELQPRRPSTSSLRGSSRYDFDDPPTSSSPFPRTPTFDGGSPRYGGPYDRDRSSAAQHLGLGLPSAPTSASRFGSGKIGPNATALSSSYNANHSETRFLHGTGDKAQLHGSTGKNRQVSSEMPLGLGIGFDLDDVLDWS